ncbi:secretion protein [Salmonella enterica subsp. enterica]|nr:secretion protein [Salmonella enterica subsp. enterica]
MIKLLAIAITLMVSYRWLSGMLNYTRQIMLQVESMVEWHNR